MVIVQGESEQIRSICRWETKRDKMPRAEEDGGKENVWSRLSDWKMKLYGPEPPWTWMPGEMQRTGKDICGKKTTFLLLCIKCCQRTNITFFYLNFSYLDPV